ncbi:MAG: Calx-beta domain-containing protein [Bacteroidota bacterium]
MKSLRCLFSLCLIFALFCLVNCGDGEEDMLPPVEENVKVSFQSPSMEVSESATSIFIPLLLEGASDKEVFVTYQASGTADFPTDVTPLTSTTFIVPPGATAFNIEMLVIEDNTLEIESESLVIELISVSDGGELGEQKTHELRISPDDVALVTFAQESTTVRQGQNVEVAINLSRPHTEDLQIRVVIDSDMDLQRNYLYQRDDEVIIPAGETFGILTLRENFFYEEMPLGEVAQLSISRVFETSGDFASGVVLHPNDEELMHTINFSNTASEEASLTATITWTSSNNDVDLDLFLLDINNVSIDFSTSGDIDGTETIVFDSDLIDGEYSLILDWFEGTGTADIVLTITPNGTALWQGGSDSETIFFNGVSESTLDDANRLALISKSGNSYTE